MNWFKKQFNKLFSDIDDEELYEYENEETDLTKSDTYVPSNKGQDNQVNRKAFRFPVIADEEIGVYPKQDEQNFPHQNIQPINITKPREYHQQKDVSSKVYDVKVSGIRELLEKRQKNTGYSSVIKSESLKRQTGEKKPESVKKVKIDENKTDKSSTLINPLVNRKRFVPTDVPSPVYGFAKPSPINKLLKKKQEQSPINDNLKEDVHSLQSTELLKVNEEFASSVEIVKEKNAEVENIILEDELIQLSEELSINIENKLEEKTVQLQSELYEKVEDFPILAEEVSQPDPPQQEIIEEPVKMPKVSPSEEVKQLNVQNESEKVDAPKEKTMPFNVLMLNSDKQKLTIKMADSSIHNNSKNVHEVKSEFITTSLNELEQTSDDKGKSFVLSNETTIDNELIEHDPNYKETVEEELVDPKEQDTNAPSYEYVKPPLDFLSPPEEKTEDREWMESQAEILVEALSYFQVTAQVESIMQGPAVTQFEITVGHGTKVSKIRNLADDLKLALAAKDIRIQAPIPGKSSIGIEIPNRISRAVRLSEVTKSDSFVNSDSPLEAALGLDLTGKPVTIDLRKMPHGLIAGATGSGKSVCINSILVSLLYKADPHELKLMLIDPKMVELAPFNNIPHLVSPVITDVKAATASLKWAVEEMERRYQLFAHAGVRDLQRYNNLAESKGEYSLKLPYILIVIDELADLMMMSPADVEEAICRIAQKARACGIHLIVATQRPSVDVITGLIKSNIPTRIAFAVSSQIDSRTILDSQGAERLLGRGDMLYLGNGMSDAIRLQGTFVTDDEIGEIIHHVRQHGEPDYFFEQDELLKKTEMNEEQDDLFEEVCRFVFEQGTASTSSIQRKYHIGYNRAARLIDMLENYGFISEQKGSKPRDVFITETDLVSMFEE